MLLAIGVLWLCRPGSCQLGRRAVGRLSVAVIVMAAGSAVVASWRRPARSWPAIEVWRFMASTETEGGRAVVQAWEWEAVVPPCGVVKVGQQSVWLGPAMSGCTVTFWADQYSIHVSLDGSCFKTVPSRLGVSELQSIADHGARPAGPAPAALPAGRRRLPAHVVVEVDRTASRDGVIQLGGQLLNLGTQAARQRVTLRLDGHLMHVIAGGKLITTLPAPVPPDQRAILVGARRAATKLPPPPAGQVRVRRRVPKDGVTMVANQRLRVGRQHAGKIVTIVVEDTHFRITHDGQELGIHPRTETTSRGPYHNAGQRRPC